MPDVRTTLPVDLHRELKKEAVVRGVPLKELVARILISHLKSSGVEVKPKMAKKAR